MSPHQTRAAADVISSIEHKRARLADALAGDSLVIAPGVYDMISARLADRLGFGSLYLSGYAIAASHLGLPDAGLTSLADLVDRVRVIANRTRTPLIVDADTGFGGLLNVAHTIKELEAAGCAAIQIEDQVTPKRCGLTGPCDVIATDEMVRKLEVALDARCDPGLAIVARTDAHGRYGLEAAIERGVRFADLGVDAVFVQGIRTEVELADLCARTPKPCLVNLAGAAELAALPAKRLRAAGCRIAIHPGLGMLAAAAAMRTVYETLSREGSLAGLDAPLLDRDEMNRLVGFEDVWAFQARWRDNRA